MNRLTVGALLGPLTLLAGCSSKEDRDFSAAVSTVSAHRSAHPHYPLMAFDDFGGDNGPLGISVNVYSFYCHATTKPNPRENVATAREVTERLATVFAKAIESLITLEASNPGPKPPYPATPDWKEAPHPEPGSYEIVVGTGPKPRIFVVRCPLAKGESAATAVAAVRLQLSADAQQVVAEVAQSEKAEMQTPKPPPGFTLATTEMLNVQQGSRGIEPHLIADPLCLVPVDTALAKGGLDRGIKKLLTATGHLNPKPQTAHLVIQGPGFDSTYEVPLAPGMNQDQAIAMAEKAVVERLDELNRTAS